MKRAITLTLATVMILSVAQAQAVPLTGLLAHYKLDELSGTTASDSAGSANGSLVNFAGNEWTTGIIDNALPFVRASSQYVTANGLAGSLSTGDDYSVTAWFNTTFTPPTNQGHQIFSAHTASDGNIFRLGTSINGGIFFSDAGDQVFGSGFNDGMWHLLTVSRTTTTLNVAVDGTTVAGFVNGNPAWSTATKFSIGQEYDPGSNPTDFFNGTLDDITVWNRALSAAETQEIYENGLLGFSIEGPPVVPEPTTGAMLGLGMLVAGLARKRRQRMQKA